MQYQLMQAKAELKTLSKRTETTKASIEILEAAFTSVSGENAGMSASERTELLVTSLVSTNLKQLRENLKEGEERMTYLLDAINKAEAQVKPATVIHPANSGRRH